MSGFCTCNFVLGLVLSELGHVSEQVQDLDPAVIVDFGKIKEKFKAKIKSEKCEAKIAKNFYCILYRFILSSKAAGG